MGEFKDCLAIEYMQQNSAKSQPPPPNKNHKILRQIMCDLQTFHSQARLVHVQYLDYTRIQPHC